MSVSCIFSSMMLTFLKPISSAYCLKHRRQMLSPYFRIKPWVLLHTRLWKRTILFVNFTSLKRYPGSPVVYVSTMYNQFENPPQ